MCGLAGVIAVSEVDCRLALERAQQIQAHRGPDGTGSLVQRVGNWSVGLGHQRLAIIDLSSTGSQPMTVDDGKHWLVFNGEAYNYLEVRPEVTAQGAHFDGTSDSEVLLRALSLWGKAALPKFNGMWAFAWLDLQRQRLVLCRDRLGVKPLYLYVREGRVYFASELKTILEMSGERHRLNHQVVGEYALQSLLETSEETFFEGIVKVAPGSTVEFDLAAPTLTPRVESYWSLNPTESSASLDEAAAQVRELLIDAVRLRLRSDVPVGVLLSGGVDSSSLAACMQGVLGKGANLNLLSAVSDGGRFDESPFIDRMSEHLGLVPHKVRLDMDSRSALELLEKVCWYNDEPVGSFSNAAHFLLMKRARELGITVILSGQGADEIFCGYKKFVGFYIQRLLRERRWLSAGKTMLAYLRRGTVLNQFSIDEAKRYLPRLRSAESQSVAGPALAGYRFVPIGLQDGQSIRCRQVLDLKRLSVPVLTHYEDRMSMAWGREVRTPFLDYRVVEAALALPTNFKLAHGWTKYVLRKAMEPLLPPAIAWRRDKQSFVNPQGEWLKNELRSTVEDVLSEDSLVFKLGLLSRQALRALYEKYRLQPAGRGSISFKEIFQPVALEVWLRNYRRYLTY
jgi:asparagine synthase (glutamine-hydrolysing)